MSSSGGGEPHLPGGGSGHDDEYDELLQYAQATPQHTSSRPKHVLSLHVDMSDEEENNASRSFFLPSTSTADAVPMSNQNLSFDASLLKTSSLHTLHTQTSNSKSVFPQQAQTRSFVGEKTPSQKHISTTAPMSSRTPQQHLRGQPSTPATNSSKNPTRKPTSATPQAQDGRPRAFGLSNRPGKPLLAQDTPVMHKRPSATSVAGTPRDDPLKASSVLYPMDVLHDESVSFSRRDYEPLPQSDSESVPDLSEQPLYPQSTLNQAPPTHAPRSVPLLHGADASRFSQVTPKTSPPRHLDHSTHTLHFPSMPSTSKPYTAGPSLDHSGVGAPLQHQPNDSFAFYTHNKKPGFTSPDKSPHPSTDSPVKSGPQGGSPRAVNYFTSADLVDDRRNAYNTIIDRNVLTLKAELQNEALRYDEKYNTMVQARVNEETSRIHRRYADSQRQVEDLKHLLSQYEENVSKKDGLIASLTDSINKEREQHAQKRALEREELAKHEEKREGFTCVMADRYYHQTLLRRLFRDWHSCVQSKWKERIERACQAKAQEVCRSLTVEYEAKISALMRQLHDASQQIEMLNEKRLEHEENLKKAFMRGVCALNMEAMTMFGPSRMPQGDLLVGDAMDSFDPALAPRVRFVPDESALGTPHTHMSDSPPYASQQRAPPVVQPEPLIGGGHAATPSRPMLSSQRGVNNQQQPLPSSGSRHGHAPGMPSIPTTPSTPAQPGSTPAKRPQPVVTSSKRTIEMTGSKVVVERHERSTPATSYRVVP